MDCKNYKLNVIPSPIDDRDYKVKDIIANATKQSFPKEFCLEYKGQIKDQGNVGSCVANSLAYTREITETKQTGKYNQFSVGYIYGNRKDTDSQDEGMIPREALQNLVDFGDVYYNNFPYNDEYLKVKAKVNANKNNLLKLASPNKITSYYQCENAEDVKYALMNLGAVTMCLAVYDSFYMTPYNENYILQDADVSSEELYGGHEITIIGWKSNNTFIAINSWGKEWADNGKFYIPFKSNTIVEMWAITDNILPTPPPLKTYYSVQVYAFKDRNNANLASNKLRSQKINCCLVYKDGYFKIQCGCFSNIANRDTMVNKLKALGYNPCIVKIEK